MAGIGDDARGRPLRVGLFLPLDEAALPDGPPRWADLLALAARAEALGLDSLWLPDHLLYRFPDAPPTGQWECWSVLAALLAKMADTVDEISGGRLVLGLGAGYHEPEYAAALRDLRH